VICREWLETWRTTVEPAQYKKALARLEKNVFPWLGGRPIPKLTPDEVEAIALQVAKTSRIAASMTLPDLDDEGDQEADEKPDGIPEQQPAGLEG